MRALQEARKQALARGEQPPVAETEEAGSANGFKGALSGGLRGLASAIEGDHASGKTERRQSSTSRGAKSARVPSSAPAKNGNDVGHQQLSVSNLSTLEDGQGRGTSLDSVNGSTMSRSSSPTSSIAGSTVSEFAPTQGPSRNETKEAKGRQKQALRAALEKERLEKERYQNELRAKKKVAREKERLEKERLADELRAKKEAEDAAARDAALAALKSSADAAARAAIESDEAASLKVASVDSALQVDLKDIEKRRALREEVLLKRLDELTKILLELEASNRSAEEDAERELKIRRGEEAAATQVAKSCAVFAESLEAQICAVLAALEDARGEHAAVENEVSEKLSQVKSDLCLKAAEVRKEALADFETKQAAAIALDTKAADAKTNLIASVVKFRAQEDANRSAQQEVKSAEERMIVFASRSADRYKKISDTKRQAEAAAAIAAAKETKSAEAQAQANADFAARAASIDADLVNRKKNIAEGYDEEKAKLFVEVAKVDEDLVTAHDDAARKQETLTKAIEAQKVTQSRVDEATEKIKHHEATLNTILSKVDDTEKTLSSKAKAAADQERHLAEERAALARTNAAKTLREKVKGSQCTCNGASKAQNLADAAIAKAARLKDIAMRAIEEAAAAEKEAELAVAKALKEKEACTSSTALIKKLEVEGAEAEAKITLDLGESFARFAREEEATVSAAAKEAESERKRIKGEYDPVKMTLLDEERSISRLLEESCSKIDQLQWEFDSATNILMSCAEKKKVVSSKLVELQVEAHSAQQSAENTAAQSKLAAKTENAALVNKIQEELIKIKEVSSAAIEQVDAVNDYFRVEEEEESQAKIEVEEKARVTANNAAKAADDAQAAREEAEAATAAAMEAHSEAEKAQDFAKKKVEELDEVLAKKLLEFDYQFNEKRNALATSFSKSEEDLSEKLADLQGRHQSAESDLTAKSLVEQEKKEATAVAEIFLKSLVEERTRNELEIRQKMKQVSNERKSSDAEAAKESGSASSRAAKVKREAEAAALKAKKTAGAAAELAKKAEEGKVRVRPPPRQKK